MSTSVINLFGAFILGIVFGILLAVESTTVDLDFEDDKQQSAFMLIIIGIFIVGLFLLEFSL